jgi:uncharacterized membrane protein SpoIIM required for sporulation
MRPSKPELELEPTVPSRRGERFVLRSFRFRKEREARWAELEELVVRVEERGAHTLSAKEVLRLPVLYQAALSSLSVARNLSLDRALLDYLEGLATRAYLVVYGRARRRSGFLRDFFGRRFAQSVFEARRMLALSAALLLLGVACGGVLTTLEPERFYGLISAEQAAGRTPDSPTASLVAALHGTASSSTLFSFAAMLFTNNAKVAMLAFAVGFLGGVPTGLVLFVNGLSLGALSAVYASRGISLEFWCWILPHGVTELLAILIGGASGLSIGARVLFPGHGGRRYALAQSGRESGSRVIGAVCMLLFAALLESFFRQSVHDLSVRAAVALSTALFWMYYFGWVGSRRPLEAEAA